MGEWGSRWSGVGKEFGEVESRMFVGAGMWIYNDFLAALYASDNYGISRLIYALAPCAT